MLNVEQTQACCVMHSVSAHMLKSPRQAHHYSFYEFILFASGLHCEEPVTNPVFMAKS